jgi:hypothetical protein
MEIIRKKCKVKGCGKVIEGTQESEVEHNLQVHMMTHMKVEGNGD